MDRPRNNRFLEPERGSGLVGWATKQLALWLVGGVLAYAVLGNHLFFGGGSTASRPPAAAARTGDQGAALVNTLTLRARSDGHVLLDAEVNGVPIRFIVDTGATWVSLTRRDAVRAGVAGGLSYSAPMTTANGTAKAAPVTLHEVRIGQLDVDEVAAMVLPEEAGISLLGQSFLNRLQGYEMRDGALTLTWD